MIIGQVVGINGFDGVVMVRVTDGKSLERLRIGTVYLEQKNDF